MLSDSDVSRATVADLPGVPRYAHQSAVQTNGPRSISETISALHERAATLENYVDGLATRLQPILSPPKQSAQDRTAVDAPKPSFPRSDTAGALEVLLHRLESLLARLHNVHDRVEL